MRGAGRSTQNRRNLSRVDVLRVLRVLRCTSWLLVAAAVAAQTPGVHPISGRRFAPVMGYQGADWLERAERDDEEAPDVALGVLKIAKGASVAEAKMEVEAEGFTLSKVDESLPRQHILIFTVAPSP